MWIVTKDNKMVFKGTNNKCFEYVLNDQGNSVDYACKYGGYKILEDKPEDGVQYALTGGPGEKCIANGNTWLESRIIVCTIPKQGGK